MLQVNNHLISASISEIIDRLKIELAENGETKFYKSFDSGDNYMVCCPIHKNGQERKPSMGIRKSDGVCHCFSCGYTSTLSEMISNSFGYNDFGLFGSQWLVRNFVSISVEERADLNLDYSRDIKSEPKKEYVSDEELDKYRYYHSYWTKRGICDEAIIELFDLGFDNDTKCITMPVRDKDGNCLFVARRSVLTKFFNYPRNVEKPLYGLYELQRSNKAIINEIYVCESMIDCILLWQAGYYAVALNGLGTKFQMRQLEELPCRVLVLATDMDKAGMSARQRIKQSVKHKLFKEVFLPAGRKDIGECTEDEIKNLIPSVTSCRD